MITFLKEYILGKKILVLGFGREGKSTFKRLYEAGGFEVIGVADLNPVELPADQPANLITGSAYQTCMNDYDIVFKSPGIVLEKDFDTYSCEIVSQTELFFRKYHKQCIGITGTKGKSTTTTLIYHILKQAGMKTVLAGNIGIPVFDMLDEIEQDTRIVCELSCHQLEYAQCVPHIGLLLNIHEEHLDHYGTMEKYVAAKENIYRKQIDGDYIICGSEVLPEKGTCRSHVIEVCDHHLKNVNQEAYCLHGHQIETNHHYLTIPVDQIQLIGQHNYLDIAFAYAACQRLHISDEIFLDGLKTYSPLPHRLEYVGLVDGVRYYDDSISTICETTIQALNSIPCVDAVIIGGMDRGIDYTDLIEFLSGANVPHIILMEATGKRIHEEIIAGYPLFKRPERIKRVEHLEEAVEVAKACCQPGSACVMSPAAASYGIFKNFEERGDVFKTLVLKGK